MGAFLTFDFVFASLEYIPTLPPLSSYVINICSKEKDHRYLKKNGRELNCILTTNTNSSGAKTT